MSIKIAGGDHEDDAYEAYLKAKKKERNMVRDAQQAQQHFWSKSQQGGIIKSPNSMFNIDLSLRDMAVVKEAMSKREKLVKPRFVPNINIFDIVIKLFKKDYHSMNRLKALTWLSSSIIMIIFIIAGIVGGTISLGVYLTIMPLEAFLIGGNIALNICEYDDYKLRLREYNAEKEARRIEKEYGNILNDE